MESADIVRLLEADNTKVFKLYMEGPTELIKNLAGKLTRSGIIGRANAGKAGEVIKAGFGGYGLTELGSEIAKKASAVAAFFTGSGLAAYKITKDVAKKKKDEAAAQLKAVLDAQRSLKMQLAEAKNKPTGILSNLRTMIMGLHKLVADKVAIMGKGHNITDTVSGQLASVFMVVVGIALAVGIPAIIKMLIPVAKRIINAIGSLTAKTINAAKTVLTAAKSLAKRIVGQFKLGKQHAKALA